MAAKKNRNSIAKEIHLERLADDNHNRAAAKKETSTFKETIDLTEMSLTVPVTKAVIPMPDLPPVGSLWRHRDSGERRFVNLHSRLGDITYIGFNEVGLITYRLAAPEKWLSWQANAERIDKEQ